MNPNGPIDFIAIRDALASFELSPNVEPNEQIALDRTFFPEGHRGVLDVKRQLVVGNRGMGKSFWTHALRNIELRERLAHVYNLPALATTEVVIGFNGSERLTEIAPTTDEVANALKSGCEPELIWRAVLLRAAHSFAGMGAKPTLDEALRDLQASPQLYANVLTAADDALAAQKKSLLVAFDALDRLGDWGTIRALTKGLLVRAVGLQSFHAIRAKIFMRVDQFADTELFRFPDSSKITNDRVDLTWRPYELYGLLLFELLRCRNAKRELLALAAETNTRNALPQDGKLNTSALDKQVRFINALAGEFMGGHKKRGRVYTWVPLHLGDADNNCSPRTFLTAWKSAAGHVPPPPGDRAVDHLGLIDGVRRASATRLAELREDYPWIDRPLEPLRRQFVPISQDELFDLWQKHNVVRNILSEAEENKSLAPIDLIITPDPSALLKTMARIAVMEVRANGKINVPDIFRVEAEILRKGGVAVPRRY